MLWVPLGLALLLLGWWLPLREVYGVGAVTAAAGVAVIVFRISGGLRGTRPRPLLVATVVLATFAAGALVQAPRLVMSQSDGPYVWHSSRGTGDDRFGAFVDEVKALPHVLLMKTRGGLRGRDPQTGESTFAIWTKDGRVFVGPDGNMAVYDSDEIRYYSAAGSLLWQLAHPSGVPVERALVAMGNGTIVLRDCLKDSCVYTGHGPSAAVLWTATGAHRETQFGPVGNDHISSTLLRVAPTVVAIDPNPPIGEHATLIRTTTVRGADGRILGTTRGNATAVIGETVVLDVGGCQLAAVRGGKAIWTTQGLPCTKGAWKANPRYFEKRLYFKYFTDDEWTGTVTVGLDDGQWRATGPLQTDFDSRFLPHRTTGVAGDEMWVERRGRTLTGVDAATGQARWTFRAPGPLYPTMLTLGPGAVVVASSPGERLTELTGEHDACLITVLDARTGRTTARLVLPHPRNSGISGVAPGRAFIQGYSFVDGRDADGLLGRP
ncbi:PQQ-binding-like beta-propeller repeat protein [Micromonospora sp. KLBMP9576]|uniref:outer membrane protein assembly factor BamB family protein n=1 Tax=Micromonospora sp. KLBMP9576 TaxID=3424769 RepID=UPI003D9480D9